MSKLGMMWRMGAVLLMGMATGAAQAATAWDEALSGDFSNNGLVPTLVAVANGSNNIFGTTGNPGSGIDRDYFSFTVPTGSVWTGLKLLNNTSVSGGSSFIGIQAGPQLTVTPTGGGVENLLGFTHYSNDQVGSDILPGLVFGYNGGLPSGTYSIWVQETSGPVGYGMDLVITPVPEPQTYPFLLAGIGLVALAARRRKAIR